MLGFDQIVWWEVFDLFMLLLIGIGPKIALVPFIDSIVMVVEAGKTSNRDVQKALEMLPTEKFLGFVMNKQSKSKDFDDSYRYYGGNR